MVSLVFSNVGFQKQRFQTLVALVDFSELLFFFLQSFAQHV